MKGNQIPRIRIEPSWNQTDGAGASMLMSAYGVKLDEWQELVLNSWLAKDSLNNYIVTSAGLSVPRQNGKNCIIEAREFYGLVVNGERILHTAHQVRTAKRSFRRLVNMFTDKTHPEITGTIKKIRFGVGEESIELQNGGMIEFIARSRQAARGYEGISLVVYDEAQELTDDQAEAIMSVLSASTTGIRQLLYVGTPPYVGCPGTVFRRFRDACINSAGRNEVLHNCWHEWSVSADKLEEINLEDKKLWYECNPALGTRLTEEFTTEEFKTLSSDGFARERLGWFFKAPEILEAGSDFIISAELWDSCASKEPRPNGKTAFGVKFTPDGSEVVLAGAVIPESGNARITLLAIEPTGKGISWLASWLNERYHTASCIVIDGKNGTDLLIDRLKDTWRLSGSVIKASSQNVIAAASMLINDLNEHNLTWYIEQEELRNSAITATKRPIGSAGWGFGGQTCAPIEACSLALWGCRTTKRNPQKKMRIG